MENKRLRLPGPSRWGRIGSLPAGAEAGVSVTMQASAPASGGFQFAFRASLVKGTDPAAMEEAASYAALIRVLAL